MSKNKYSYTAILSTFNEEHRIEYALRNFHGRAHILVVDNYSTDRTVEIARKYTDHVVLRKNPGFLTPECYRFRFEESPTDYVLISYAGQFHPLPLLKCYEDVARSRSHKAVAVYNQVYSYGVAVNTYSRPYSNRTGVFKLFDKTCIDLLRSVIHNELPFIGGRDDIYYPPRKRSYCVVSFRDDLASSSELKHARYADADAVQRYEKGERTNFVKMAYIFSKHLLGCLLWRGALWQGMPGIINSIWRANYFLSVEIRIWEQQNGLTKESVAELHNKLKKID